MNLRPLEAGRLVDWSPQRSTTTVTQVIDASPVDILVSTHASPTNGLMTKPVPTRSTASAPDIVLETTPPKPQTPSQSPSLKLLREKMFAVHATDLVPQGGVMVAGARAIDPEKADKEPASFRPTLHFALGEMVRPHGRSSWEEKKYAVVLPLKDLEPQLTNVAPHDSFILGNFRIPEGAIFLAPEGAELEGLPDDVSVRRYKGDLRKAVSATIEDNGGWPVQMSGVTSDDPARIGERDINNPTFFKSLLDERPDLSFGTHIGSEVGEAYRFGVVEQSLLQLTRQWDRFGFPLETGSVKLYRALIDHNLERLQVVDHPAAREAVEAKRQHISSYLKLTDVDIGLRQRGLSLASTSESTQKLACKLSVLGPLGAILLKSQLSVAEEGPPSVGGLVEALSALPPNEVKEFQAKNPDVFEGVDPGVFQARYGVSRWLHQREDKEGLEAWVLEGIGSAKHPVGLLEELKENLKQNSHRSETALSILRRPVVQMNLAQEDGMTFSPGGPQSVMDAIKAHPKARRGLEAWSPQVAPDQEKALELLEKMELVRSLSACSQPDFESAVSKAHQQDWNQRDLERHLEEIGKPMNTVRFPDQMRGGDTLGAYELLRRDGSVHLDLSPDLWNSTDSLLQLYNRSEV